MLRLNAESNTNAEVAVDSLEEKKKKKQHTTTP